jgi:2-polyprenyl-3-methyl-5-hydroxy-6-metoxy-1,4-benzoquinol methylase
MEDLKNQYRPELYEKIKDNGYNYAKIIIPELQKFFSVKSVIDIGCGGGSFLHGCIDDGITDVLGIDGEHVRGNLQIDIKNFMPVDLEKPFTTFKIFDLCVSLEVGEHLNECFSDTFIDTICRHSNNVLFSAAQVGQPGIHHVNNQPLEYWQKKFESRGYMHIEAVSNWIRNNRNIYHWYRRNSMLFRQI